MLEANESNGGLIEKFIADGFLIVAILASPRFPSCRLARSMLTSNASLFPQAVAP